MVGAILGDIIGSPYEFDQGDKTKEFELFSLWSEFTDDSVMTVAVAEALMKAGIDADVEEIKEACIDSMKDWGMRYPDSGFGGRFYWWVLSEDREPYGSYGNGSAMRVSPAGWLYESLERTREVARATAEVTHNHPEGIKGAEAEAMYGVPDELMDECKTRIDEEMWDVVQEFEEFRNSCNNSVE